MSITPNVPQQPETPQTGNSTPGYATAATPRWVAILIVVLFLGLGGLAYFSYAARTKLQADLDAANGRAALLAKELDQTNTRVADLRGQLDVTSQKLGLTRDELARARTLAQQIQQQQRQSDAKLGEQIGQVQQESEAKIGQVSTELSGAKTDIAATQKDLAAAQGRLTSTIGDLGVQSGLVATNRQELEELKRLGERNIYDFNLKKSKKPQRVGPIQIALRKTDPKHYRFTMIVVADDKAIEKKDRNVDEPMQFYVRGARSPYEIVVFNLTKDQATGYLSTPKETASAAAPARAN
jgi:predicted  nucleic acid-binding Zn-ribbon protein